MNEPTTAKVKTKRAFDIREGDVWAFQTNSGTLGRAITCVHDGRVYYRAYGDPYERDCAIATFRRWWRGAYLECATDWTNRSASP